MVSGGEVLVLRDEAGEYYVVSRETIEQGKLEGDLRDQVAAAVEGEVSGFALGQTQLSPLQISQNPSVSGLFTVIGTFNYQLSP